MICKKCSTENPENAAFCQHCGKRLDGKVVCPKCGTANEEQANFCLACGFKLNDLNVCSECGETYQGNFCPKCGTSALPAATIAYPQYAAQKTAKPSVWRKVLEYVGGGLAMAAVFFALLFTFLIGSSLAINSSLATVNVSGIANIKQANISLYYYFGDVYKEIETALTAANEYDEGYSLALYMPAILGTLVSAATIICVLTFAVLALVRYLRKVVGKSEKDYGTFAVISVLSYLAGAVALKALTAVSVSVTGTTYDYTTGTVTYTATAGMKYNAATIAGIVLSVVFLAAFIGLRIAINAKNVWKKKRLVTLCLSAGGVLLFGLALQFLSGTITALLPEAVQGTSSGTRMSIGGGYNMLIEMLCAEAKQSVNGKVIMTFTEKEIVILVLALVGLLVHLLSIIFTAIATAQFFSNLKGEKGKGNLAFAIVAQVLAVLHLVFTVVTTAQYGSYAKLDEDYKWNYAPVICGLIFTTLAFALTVVHKVFMHQEPKEELQA